MGQINSNKPKDNWYLTEEQARHVYQKTESGGMINTDTLCQKIEQERELNRIDVTSRDINPYEELIVNNAEKIESLINTNGPLVYPE